MRETEKRRSGRVLGSVPIQIIGQDARGCSFVENAVAVCFNQQGARLSLTRSLITDAIVLIRNPQNGIEEEFRVVGGFQQVIGNRQEWGVEAISLKTTIWGVEFTPTEDKDQVKALIECAACHQAALTPLSSIEFDVLVATGAISRHCDRCEQTTRWKPSEQHLTSEIVAAGSRLQAIHEEMRKEKRRRLAIHVQVRDSRGISYSAETRDVPKSGLCIATQHHFQVGDMVCISFPFAGRHPALERTGKVAWATTSGDLRVYGISLLK